MTMRLVFSTWVHVLFHAGGRSGSLYDEKKHEDDEEQDGVQDDPHSTLSAAG